MAISQLTVQILKNAVGDNVLVNSAGTVQKGKFNLKDSNDMYFVTDKEGKVIYNDYKKLYTSSSTEHSHAVTVGGKPYYTE